MSKKYITQLLSLALVSLSIISCSSSEARDKYAKYTTEELQTQADAYIQKGQYSRAIFYLEGLETKANVLDIDKVQLDLIKAYYEHKDYELGLAVADSFLQRRTQTQNPENVDYVLYLRGLMHYNFTNSFILRTFKQDIYERDVAYIIRAYNDFATLTQVFPASKYASEAAAKMKEIADKLSEKEYKTVKFYYDRKAYIATIRRVQQMQEKFGNTKYSQQALALMVDSYNKLNMPESAALVEKYLQTLTPDQSKGLPKGLQIPKENPED